MAIEYMNLNIYLRINGDKFFVEKELLMAKNMLLYLRGQKDDMLLYICSFSNATLTQQKIFLDSLGIKESRYFSSFYQNNFK